MRNEVDQIDKQLYHIKEYILQTLESLNKLGITDADIKANTPIRSAIFSLDFVRNILLKDLQRDIDEIMKRR